MFGMGTGVASPPESPGFFASVPCFGCDSTIGAQAREREAPADENFDSSELFMVSRSRHDGADPPGPATDPWSVAEEVKPSTISTAQLHPSPDFHMPPIKQVVSLRSYPVDPVGNLISRKASHLDAFSAYPHRT